MKKLGIKIFNSIDQRVIEFLNWLVVEEGFMGMEIEERISFIVTKLMALVQL